jgi:hypothetical protein
VHEAYPVRCGVRLCLRDGMIWPDGYLGPDSYTDYERNLGNLPARSGDPKPTMWMTEDQVAAGSKHFMMLAPRAALPDLVSQLRTCRTCRATDRVRDRACHIVAR